MPNTTSAPPRSSAYTSACAPVARTRLGPVTGTRGVSADPCWAGPGSAGAGGSGRGCSAAWEGSAARVASRCGERAARSRGLGTAEAGGAGLPAGLSGPAEPLRPVICSVIGWSPWLALSTGGRRHKKSPRAGRQSRGARSYWLGQLAARRPSTRICEDFTGNTLLRPVIGTSTDGGTVSHPETRRLIRFVVGWPAGRLPRGPDPFRPHEGFDAGGGHRPGDQEALPVVAGPLAQRAELAGLLDALGDDPQAELAADLHHGLGQQGQGVVVAEARHERRVDLDDVQWHLAQVGQRRVPDAEVVDGQPHSQLEQLRET